MALLKGAALYAPVLLTFELANTARKKAILYPKQKDALIEALRLGLSLDIHWVDVDHQRVVELALEAGLTTYDASYLYAAQLLGLPLVTFDQELQRVYIQRGGLI